jgi:hypothetical protein
MAQSPSPNTTLISWLIRTVSLPGLTFPAARLSFQLLARSVLPARQVTSIDCWVDTGAPLTVIPFHVHDQRLLWKRVPGVTATWAAQHCDLGQVDVWLPTEQSPYVRGPLSLLAKFAQSDPPGPPVPVLLGLEFLPAHQVEFQLHPPPRNGTILLP